MARQTVATLDLRPHHGAHPRLGTLDVVPWVSLEGWPVTDGPIEAAVQARDNFAAGPATRLPCFVYGPERSFPDLRRQAWRTLRPDTGPRSPPPDRRRRRGRRPADPHRLQPLAGRTGPGRARAIAGAIRGPERPHPALAVGDHVQVSCNLIDPWSVGPEAAFDAVASDRRGRAELVGLAPGAVLDADPRHRWRELDLDPSTTIEARLEQAGLDGGRFAIHERS